jgi:hypothetical protein
MLYKRDCGSNCIVSAIMNQTSLILDAKTDNTTQKEALMFLIHFLGDIHQPLHTESLSRGGNGIHVCFDQRCGRENLHAIWDTDILHKMNGLHHHEKHNAEKTAAKKFADELYDLASEEDSFFRTGTKGQCVDVGTAEGVEECAMEWAVEVNELVCGYVLQPGVWWLENHDLGGTYYEGAKPVLRTLVTKAGIRLAAWINALADARLDLEKQRFENEEL